ncbi:phage portal protein [Verrucomicrobium spinosum]|uniref:phage portal protein n=1 Tax=Verrucomicrobium spinosum TaxID=2736 RepID=UPI00155DA63D|nr:phage portal protein [Verrucomicrobium spinosum]
MRAISAPDLTLSAMQGSFQGAEFSRDRGYIYLPTLDTKKEVDEWSRLELLKRSRFIYNSGGGLIHRAVNGVARMVVGTGLMPYPLVKNKEWSRRVRMLYSSRCGSANTFHLGKRFNTGQAQRAIIRCKIKDGDGAAVLARDEETNRLRIALYESNQIGNGRKHEPNKRWHDGVLLDQHTAAQAFRFLGTNDRNQETTVDVPAENVLFFANYERINQVRGLTRFYPVLNKVLDRGEIMAALTKGIKVASHIAYVIEEAAQQTSNVAGAGGALAPRPQKFIETNDGKKISLEQFLMGGEAWGLKPGQTFKMVQSTNPSQNVREHLNDLVRDVALALDYFPEILWNIIGLGGANMRFVQADTQSKIEEEQEDLVDQFLGPHYIAWLRDMIEHGEIEDIEGWENHAWLAPARLTVDFGRDGKLHIEQYKRGMITMKSLYGFRGEEWQIEIDQYLDERLYIKEGVEARKLTWEEAYPEQRQQTIEPAKDEEEEEDKIPEVTP